jgi:hypothetical protein
MFIAQHVKYVGILKIHTKFGGVVDKILLSILEALVWIPAPATSYPE